MDVDHAVMSPVPVVIFTAHAQSWMLHTAASVPTQASVSNNLLLLNAPVVNVRVDSLPACLPAIYLFVYVCM